MKKLQGRDNTRYRNPLVPVLTSQNNYEFQELLKMYSRRSPKHVLEIGSQDGGTLWHWIKLGNKDAKFVVIDIKQGKPADFDPEPQWQSWCGQGQNLKCIFDYSNKEDAVHQATKFVDYRFDFVFIDGDHSYEGAKSDFEIYSKYVNPGGVIAFHDLITPTHGRQNHIQVGRYFKELQALGYVTQEIYSCENQVDMGIGLVYL